MRQLTYTLLSIVIVAFIATCCSGNHNSQQLDIAEMIMDAECDSALRVLNEIDPSGFNESEYARYALLKSQALDKNYIEVYDDSLINIAYRYYLGTTDQRRKMLACYYFAAVNLNTGNIGAALSAALQSEKLAIDNGDAATASLAECVIGILFSNYFNYSQAITYHKRSLANAKKAGKTKWQANEYSLIAGDYISSHIFDSAKIYLDSAKVLSDCDSPDLRLQEFMIYAGLKYDDSTDSIYRHMIGANDIVTPRIHAYAALANYRLGNMERYAGLISLSRNQAKNWNDSVDIANISERIAILENDYESAYNASLYPRDETGKLFNQLADNSLYKLQVAHEQLINEDLTRQYKYSRRTVIMLVIILACTVIAAGILLLYLRALKRRRMAERKAIEEQQARMAAEEELSRQQTEMRIKSLNDRYNTALVSITEKERALDSTVATLQALRDTSQKLISQHSDLIALKSHLEIENQKLRHKNNDLTICTKSYTELEKINTRLQNELYEIRNRMTGQEDSLRDSLKKQYEWIDRLAYLRTKIKLRNTADRDKFLRDIDTELNHTRTHKFFDSLQKEIDETRNNLISRIREQCHSLDENDIMLLSYFCIGMTTHALEVVTGKGSNVIYKSKSRIKSIIHNEAPEILTEMTDIFRQTTH